MDRLTIDEVIGHCKRKVAKIESMFRKEHLESDNCGITDVIQKEYWEHRQVAEWLEELKIYKECNISKTNFSMGYNKAIDDVMEKAKEIQEEQIKNLQHSKMRNGKQ